MYDRDYAEFIARRSQLGNMDGFEPLWIPDWLFDFQQCLGDWSIRKGRAALLTAPGTGKTPMQLVFCENAIRHTNKPALIATPIAVGQQTVAEAEKFGIQAVRTKNGIVPPNANIVVTNYEQLHKYSPDKFCCLVCDESGCIKNFETETKKVVVEFMRTLPYRLLCTATAAPNDYWELGTSSEALGLLGWRDMITTFFKQETSKDHRGWGRTKYRFRGHAEEPFWKWVCSWARSLRMPSDLGFSDERFILPKLIQKEIVVATEKCRPGMLFRVPARDMREERAERRDTLKERCEKAVEIAMAVDGPCVLWCELNPEGDLLESMLEDVVQVKGTMTDEAKEDALLAFSTGQVKRLVIKSVIGAWGLNWQHCCNTTVFPSHSWERFFQLVHRFYRFGQTSDVNVSIILGEGEQGIMQNLRRKQAQADRMFEMIVKHMRDSMALTSADYFPHKEEVPEWLFSTN